MTAHYFISTLRPILDFHTPNNDYPYVSGEAYKESLPFTLPYVYEFGGEGVEFISFLDELMDIGDVVEQYIFEEGRNGISLSSNHPDEARNINLLNKTYTDQYGTYQLSMKDWKEDLSKRIIASKRSVTTFVKY